MDRLEPARIFDTGPVSEDSKPDPGRRHPMNVARHLLTRRFLLAIVGSIAAAALIGVGLIRLTRFGVDLVQRSPERTARFRDIVLDPELPPWIRPARAEFLEQFRREAGLDENVHVLVAEEREAIRIGFETRLPWARKVLGVRASYPNRLVVSLEYREPVAFVPMTDSPSIFLDEDGVVLPADEVKTPSPTIDRLIQLDLPPGESPAIVRPGRALALIDRPEARPRTEPVLAFTRLAADLHRRGGIAGRLRFRAIQMDRNAFWVDVEVDLDGNVRANADRTWIRWGQAPGDERPGELSASEKWERLRDWLSTHSLSEAKRPAFLRFRDGGIEIQR